MQTCIYGCLKRKDTAAFALTSALVVNASRENKENSGTAGIAMTTRPESAEGVQFFKTIVIIIFLWSYNQLSISLRNCLKMIFRVDF